MTVRHPRKPRSPLAYGALIFIVALVAAGTILHLGVTSIPPLETVR